MKITIINGPNLNLLGKREPEIYGNQSFMEYFSSLKKKYASIDLHYLQSNIEGEIVDFVQQNGFDSDGIILNAGGYTHTSVAIADAVAAIKSPVIEVHISNIFAREDHRHISFLGAKAKGSISGFGLSGYELAIEWFVRNSSQIK